MRPIDAPSRRRHDARMDRLRDTLDGWHPSARWPASRRRRYRLGLLLYMVGLRRFAVRVARMPTQSGSGR
jgi:hypothetical protein